jgi:hypothetical protein
MVEDSAVAVSLVADEPEASITHWKEVQGVTLSPLQQLRKDGLKEEGELDECDKVCAFRKGRLRLCVLHRGTLL